jgi:uroporphyrinogen III methyltransferase / synthase
MTGRVFLVGAGPGDPGLLTARALELIAAADVILYDRLIPSGALDGAGAAAELLYVGKEGGGRSIPQEHTEELMIARARAGKSVVRLKGGDPFVFGRGGEEAQTLRAAGVPYEVVPGVTAGVAASAYAGIPVTFRGLASAVALVTGHEDPDKPDTAIDWQALAAFPGTLVFYMGVRRLPEIADSLLSAGRPAHEPAAVLERGTLPDQRQVAGTLATIAQRAAEAQVHAPAITVVGAVAALSPELAWLVPGPLSGLTVAVTRARPQSSGLATRLRSLGARVLQTPAISTRLLPGPPPDVAPYDLLCLTSPTGVQALFERLAAGGVDARALAGPRIAAIGPGTAAALDERGISADVVAQRAVAEGLLEALEQLQPPVRRALIARALHGRELLPEQLRARGAEVDVLALYETVPEPVPTHLLREALEADYITFTSASTVRYFLQSLDGATRRQAEAGGQPGARRQAEADGRPEARRQAEADGQAEAGAQAEAGGRSAAELPPHTRLVSIGPITTEALRERGLQAHVEASSHDVEGLVAALLADSAARGS